MRKALAIPATITVSLVALLISGGLSGCLSLNWSGGNLNEPITDATLSVLQPGEADLTRCLAALGAPNLVWEYKGDGMALAYAWFDTGAWGFRASFAFSDNTPGASFSYDSAENLGNGVVLTFDESLTLETIQRGRLNELIPTKARPAPLPEDIRR